MNPKSDYYLSFNIGFPNAFDRANGRTGSNLMVHGACSSAGCYSMTDERIGEIYALARDAFKGGQKAFQIEAFPFRMTPENMALHTDDPNFEFWKMLKDGSDHFEITGLPPKVDVCDRRYVFDRIGRRRQGLQADAALPGHDDAGQPGACLFAEGHEGRADIRGSSAQAGPAANSSPAGSRGAGEHVAGRESPPAGDRAEVDAAGFGRPGAARRGPARQQISGDIPVPEPSPLKTVEAPPAKPKKNWLQRLFSPKG